MSVRKLLIILASVMLVGMGTYIIVGASPSQGDSAIADILLRERDLPRIPGVQWTQIEDQDPEELAREIAQFVGLARTPDLPEGQAVLFLPDPLSNPLKVMSIVQGLYRYESEEAATVQYERLLEGLSLAPLGTETSITGRTEWFWGKAEGQIIEALDPIGPAYAYWFIGVQGDLVTVMQVWVFQDRDRQRPDSSDRSVLTGLIPKVMGRMTESGKR